MTITTLAVRDTIMNISTSLRVGAVALALAGFLGLSALSTARAATVTDAGGRTIEIGDTSRTVAAGGSITETLYALGLQDRIVAVDTTSLYPADALAGHPNVGYVRALSSEGLLSVKPSLILAEEDAGPQAVVDQLRSISIPFVTVPDSPDPQGIARKIRFIGEVMGKPGEADRLATTVLEDFSTLEKSLAPLAKRPKVLFILSNAGDRLLAAGSGTSADEMIRLAGGENALVDFAGFKPVNAEAIIQAAPDVVLMMSGAGRGSDHGDIERIFDNPAIAQTPAGRDRRGIAMNGLFLLGFGPRAAHAASELAMKLHPELKLAPLPDRPWVK